MKKKLSNQFAVNYLIVFILSILAALFALLLLSFAGDVLSKTLTKNNYPAAGLMRDDYADIDAVPVVENGGGVQVVDETYTVVLSKGLDTLGKTRLTPGEFTEFLMRSRSVGLPYHYDIQYNEAGRFWLIVTFPTSIRLGLDFAANREYLSRDLQNVTGALIAVILFNLLLLALFAFIFSRITAVRITKPLRMLTDGTERLREGDYAVRVNLKLKNEFAELQETFNGMAERIETETALRKSAEDERRRLVLDISHDLKNPLASTAGYAELLLSKRGLSDGERDAALRAIYDNSLRAGQLLRSLFELSALDSPDFRLALSETDICEYLREQCAGLLPAFDGAGFSYVFDIPESPVYIRLDADQLSRVFQNLADNAIRYNPPGTEIAVGLTEAPDGVVIVFKDNGVGIPEEKARDIFKPFVRADASRNSRTGGTGLGLSIAQKIVVSHGGSIALDTASGKGCAFTITLPKI
jgi:signal transduction histidine kinase